MFVISVKNRFTGKMDFHNLSDITTSSFMREPASSRVPVADALDSECGVS